jgi:predicted transcriptional regulator of viral defense system
MPNSSKRDLVFDLLSKNGAMRSRDIASHGVSPGYVKDMADRGLLSQLTRGLFSLPGHPRTEHGSLILVAAHSPACVICLLSALQFHGLTNAMPHVVWAAVPTGARVPRIADLGLRIVRMAPEPYSAGIESHVLEGVPVQIYSPAKTVADCFRFRSYVGIETAVAALKEGLDRRLFSPAELFDYAIADRVHNVIMPYVEALT